MLYARKTDFKAILRQHFSASKQNKTCVSHRASDKLKASLSMCKMGIWTMGVKQDSGHPLGNWENDNPMFE